ncbi:MAG: PcfJ domain-containing protein [Candidatus Shapirobacteria bacterium]|nr:PcfJ domain-containing protein [Candidatus Shapirobacteria bacterium]
MSEVDSPIKLEPVFFGKGEAASHLHLSNTQREAVKAITLGITEVDEAVRAQAVPDIINTLENGHPLNRLITDPEGKTIGYIACEDFVPQEAYIKYLGTTRNSGRSLLEEIPAFLNFAKDHGYKKLNFHGWNDRLNHVMEHYGFKNTRTDAMGGHNINYYERSLLSHKGKPLDEGQFEKEYQKVMNMVEPEERSKKEREITRVFQEVSGRLTSYEKTLPREKQRFEFGQRQQDILKLKLARHFQNSETIDANTLYDAIIESPKFIDNDKGSLKHLFEVHEVKTLQKLAEARKKLAERSGDQSFNPYENLFTTTSGKYYMARLLNMPHLEQESAYLKHCVGTSDSYINQMKRGEIEILSFRNVPKFNPLTQELEGDTPIFTIEYNLKTNIIEQIKGRKMSDRTELLISPNDAYFNDIIDALKTLRSTRTDNGKLRNFTEISPSELQNIHVDVYQVFTENGPVSFRDFDPDSGVFALKMGKMSIDATMSHEDVAKIVRLTKGVRCLPEEIALAQEEVSAQTKVLYVDKLSSRFFQWLPENVEHVYDSFSEGKISRESIVAGGISAKVLVTDMKQKGMEPSDYAKSMMENSDFVTLKQSEKIDLIHLTVGDMGFTDIPTTDELYQRALELGLELCPPEVGPALRLKDENQAMWSSYYIGMKQISGSDGGPDVFEVGRGGDTPWLRSVWAYPGYHWALDREFVFRLRK